MKHYKLYKILCFLEQSIMTVILGACFIFYVIFPEKEMISWKFIALKFVALGIIILIFKIENIEGDKND